VGAAPKGLTRTDIIKKTLRIAAAMLFAGGVFLGLNAGYFAIEARYRLKGVEPASEPATEQVTPDGVALEAGESELGPDELRIASVGIDVPVVYEETIDEKRFQEDLMLGVVHFPLTALPGETGNAYVFGHSSDFLWHHNPYAHAFTLLPHVKVGDVVEITDHAGKPFRYVVTETFIVAPGDTRVLDQGDGSESLLTLQTSYPFGTALSRFIVRARLMLESP